MAIEFRCPQCGKLLRTGDDTAGRQAKCPECGAVSTIPSAGGTPGIENLADSGNPYQSPSPFVSQSPEHVPGEITPQILDLSDVFSRTWSIFKEQWGNCVAAWLMIFVISTVISYALSFGGLMSGRIMFGPRLAQVGQVVGQIAGQLISIWLGIGVAIYFLKVARGQAADYSDLFNGGPHFLRIVLASLLFFVIFYAGLLLCIVPGVILALMFSQFYYLVLDRQMPILDAFSMSKDLTNGNKLTLFLIWLTMMGICIVALIPCGLGLIVAAPFFCLMFPMIYLTITGQPAAR